MSSTDKDSPVQLSVRELRQWLANLGEKHQDHFHKGQLPRARSEECLPQQDTRQSVDRPTKESTRIAAVKETQQQDRSADRSETQDSSGKQNRRVVSYSSEYPAWYFRTIEQAENRMASNGTFLVARVRSLYCRALIYQTENNHRQQKQRNNVVKKKHFI